MAFLWSCVVSLASNRKTNYASVKVLVTFVLHAVAASQKTVLDNAGALLVPLRGWQSHRHTPVCLPLVVKLPLVEVRAVLQYTKQKNLHKGGLLFGLAS